MHQQVEIITVGVANLEASEAFYTDGLGWQPLFKQAEGIYYQAGAGLVFLIVDIIDFAADIGAPISLDSAFSLGQSVDRPEQVDSVIDRARAAGARILKEPQDSRFGGYHGYFADPDGHRWEIATHRPFSIDDSGVIHLQDERV